MRVLLFTKLLTVGRVLDLVDELGARRHDVVLALADREREREHPEALAALRVEYYEEVSDGARGSAANLLRRARDYAWYLGPEHEVATFNRRRALERLVRAAGGKGADPTWPDPLIALDPNVLTGLEGTLDELERLLPPDPGVVEFVRAQAPDVVLVSPLIRPGIDQAEAVKAAALLGIPTGVPVYSWDTLSNKGRMHCVPDRVWVWNEIHRREAVELHGLDPDRVVITGAPHWDRFFALEPSCSREEFVARHGFDPDRSIVLYLGSTGTVCRDEPPVVERWLEAVRAAPEPLGVANVLVRPHPGERDSPKWTAWTPTGERVSLSDRSGKADQSLFDDLHHAAAAVGLNTSAQIEASILGKPVYTFGAGVDAPGQEGSLHFHYLLEANGGVFPYAGTLDEHVAQLAGGVAGDYDRDAVRRFAERIVRPRGLDQPVAPLVAAEVESLAPVAVA